MGITWGVKQSIIEQGEKKVIDNLVVTVRHNNGETKLNCWQKSWSRLKTDIKEVAISPIANDD